MPDWSKFKVPELKEECKARDISLTGLKLKQQLIDKLEEYETQSVYEAAGKEGLEQDDDERQSDDSHKEEKGLDVEGPAEAEKPTSPQDDDVEADKAQKEPKTSQQDAGAAPAEEKNGMLEAELESAVEPAQANDEDPASADMGVERLAPSMAPPEPHAIVANATGEKPKPAAYSTNFEAAPPSDISAPASTQIAPTELAEDQRKRKRRSVTPPPDAEEVALKKARANDGTPFTTDSGADTLKQVQAATDAAQDLREADGLPQDGSEQTVQQLEPTQAAEPTFLRPLESTASTGPDIEPSAAESEQSALANVDMEMRSPSRERSVASAIHPATSSLYIRNFKRPLHIPTLKEHIITLARPRADSDSDPIQTFYLDSIRTHALISFSSTSAAARVRAAMHDARFPDEPQREPLFVDYIPNDKVQEWIDQETGGGFGRGGGNNRRYEVMYNDGPDGTEAVLQDADTSKHKPSILPQRSSISNAPRASIASGIHPDRAPLMPRADRVERAERKPSYHERPPKRDAGETGFKALDDLFSSTTAKPKLYYKPVPPEIVDDRLDMVKGLRVGHADMGKSGEEGMKRYTFERYKGRAEWVDKGPEFGHGQRGQAILRGDRGRGRGWYRGGRGDSWRGR